MTATGLATRDLAHEAGAVGEILSACRIASNALLLFGWQREPPSSEGTAALHQADAQPGRFTRLSWATSIQGSPAYCFLIALQLPSPAIQVGDTVRIVGQGARRDEVLARLPGSFVDGSAFSLQLARAAPVPVGPLVARFLLETLLPASKAGNALASSMLASFLDHASTEDGCVEMLGGVRDHYALLHGWGRPLQGGCDAILSGAAFSLHPVREAIFVRPDITDPATGQALILAASAAQEGSVEAIFLLAHDGIRRRPVLAERRILSEAETAGHFRDLLPLIRCDADTRARLTASLRPRYEGQLTLYERGYPIRLTVDLAMSAAEAGCYLTGWMYDPAQIVAAVRLCSSLGSCVPLNDCWTRIPRPDVTAGFAADPALPPCQTAQHNHGFAVHVTGVGPSSGTEQHYLEVELKDGWCGFVPLACTTVKAEPDCARLLASVDFYLPSAHSVINRHLAPFLGKIAATVPRPLATPTLASPTLIVVPLNPVVLPRALLSHLLAHPLDMDEGLMLVCSAAWTDGALAELETLAQFYAGSRIIVRRAVGSATLHTALTLAAAQSTAQHILFLENGAAGASPGWRQSLQQAARDGAAGCVSPTVLYEDRSIRFAGAGELEPVEAEPFIRLQRPMAGLPASFAPVGPAVPTSGISTACFLMTRQALNQLARLPTAEVAAHWAPELDLLRQVRDAAIVCLWVPAVQVYAPDLPAEHSPHRSARAAIGRWSVRAMLTARGG